MALERATLYGLVVYSGRRVNFGRVDLHAAREIFIREALVNDTVTWPFDFLAHNRRVREKIEAKIEEHRRTMRWALSDLLAIPRTSVELI
jgi:ATP-dependent helicase HrpA